MNGIAARVKLAREFCALERDELGLPEDTIREIEVGRVAEPDEQTMQAIADATGFPLSYFYLGPLPDMPDAPIGHETDPKWRNESEEAPA